MTQRLPAVNHWRGSKNYIRLQTVMLRSSRGPIWNPTRTSLPGTARCGTTFKGNAALKVGCGLGDDCEYMRAAGGVVTGFDISPTAIEWCKRRFPESIVAYSVCDLFNPPDDWIGRFDFVLESYTLQVLPNDLQRVAMETISKFVAADGTLLVICRARDESSSLGQMPWPLTRRDLSTFETCGLSLVECEEYDDHEIRPVHRIVQRIKRPNHAVNGSRRSGGGD